jgi:CDP-diglyceride synthetase
MTKIQPNHILLLLLVYIAALSAMASYLEVMGIAEPQWSVILTSLLAASLIFWWYWADSTSRSYRRSPLLNIAVVAVAFVAVPYYLVRSRERGRRLPALGKMLGFFVLMVVALIVGALPFALIG